MEEKKSEEAEDAMRFEWLIQRGVAWRGCYQDDWEEGEWLYAIQDARKEVDEAMKKTNSEEKKKGEAALRNVKRCLDTCDKMVKEGKMIEAITALGRAYINVNFITNLWDYSSEYMHCYRTIDELRTSPLIARLDASAKEIHSRLS